MQRLSIGGSIHLDLVIVSISLIEMELLTLWEDCAVNVLFTNCHGS